MQCQPGGQDYHVTNFISQVLQHLTRVKKQDWQDSINTYTNQHTTATTNPSENFARHIIQLASITDDLFVAQGARFIVKPNLLTILRTEIKNQDREKRIFRYQEVVILLSAYIIIRKTFSFFLIIN